MFILSIDARTADLLARAGKPIALPKTGKENTSFYMSDFYKWNQTLKEIEEPDLREEAALRMYLDLSAQCRDLADQVELLSAALNDFILQREDFLGVPDICETCRFRLAAGGLRPCKDCVITGSQYADAGQW